MNAHNFTAGALANRPTEFLNEERLKLVAPSVFAEAQHSARSSKYTFIPTIKLVERMAKEGWLPVKATEQRVRTEDRKGYQKHMIRFRKYDGTNPTLRVGDSFVETVLVNSHDGSSAYQLDAGLFRLVCSNGLVVADSTFESLKFKHKGFDPKEVIEASYRVIDAVPQIERDVKELRDIELSPNEQKVFANAALELRFDDMSKAPALERVLAPRRYADQGNDLWTTYNRVQENMLKGGLRQPPIVTTDERGFQNVRRRTTRSIQGIDENVKLNKALWALAEGMKEIKVAA